MSDKTFVTNKQTECNKYNASTYECTAPTIATIQSSIPCDRQEIIDSTRKALFDYLNGESQGKINPRDRNGVPYGLIAVNADDVGTWVTIDDFTILNGRRIPLTGGGYALRQGMTKAEERWLKVWDSRSCSWDSDIHCFTHMPFTIGVATSGPILSPEEGIFFEYGKLGDMILCENVDSIYPTNGVMHGRKILMVNPTNEKVCKPATRFRHVATVHPENPTPNDSLDCGTHVKLLVPECDDPNYVGVGLVFSNKNMRKFPPFDYTVQKPNGQIGVTMFPNIQNGKVVFLDGIKQGSGVFQGKPSCSVNSTPTTSAAYRKCWATSTDADNSNIIFGEMCPTAGENETSKHCFTTFHVNGTYYCIHKDYLINRDVSADCFSDNEAKFFTTTPNTSDDGDDGLKSVFATVSSAFHLFTCFRLSEKNGNYVIGDTNESQTLIPHAPRLRFFIPGAFSETKCCFSADLTSTPGYPPNSYEDFICCALNGTARDNQYREGCASKLIEYCSGDNLKKTECQVFCGKAQYNCDAKLEEYCAENPEAMANDNTPVCTCFDIVKFTNYVNDITKKNPDVIATQGMAFKDPECSFPPCYRSKYKHKSAMLCPSMVMCFNKLDLQNDGTIIGDINIQQMNNCVATTTNITDPSDPSGTCEISGYTQCTKTCGGGIQYPIYPIGRECTGPARPCNTQACEPADCNISWSGDWSKCNVACGKGVQVRSGKVIAVDKDGGKKCSDICNNMYQRPECIAMTECEGTDCGAPPAAGVELTTGQKVAGGVGILFVVILVVQFVIPMVMGYFAGKSQNSSEKSK